MKDLLTRPVAFYFSILLLIVLGSCSKDPAERLEKIEAKIKLKEAELQSLITSVGCQDLDSYKIWPDTTSVHLISNCASTTFYAVHQSIESRFLELQAELKTLSNSYWENYSIDRYNTLPCQETIWTSPIPVDKVCEDGTVRFRSVHELDKTTVNEQLTKLEAQLANYVTNLKCDNKGEWKITESYNRSMERKPIAYDAKGENYETVRKMIGTYHIYLHSWINLEKPNRQWDPEEWRARYKLKCVEGKPIIKQVSH